METIKVEQLCKRFDVPVKGEGLAVAVGSLWKKEYRKVEAVRGVSFVAERGEMIGFLGPNGAGKTTTLKMLSGVLHPTGGVASVLGFTPWERNYRFLKRIAMVRGSRPLSVPGELTVLDALRFQQLLYEVDDTDFRRNLAELNDLLSLEPLLARQVRALSLGERMRCGLAWALLYRPEVLFLDEPTLGLDVSAVSMMRRFISNYNRQTGATVLLTSHYMADVERLCGRIVLIDRGALVFDGDLSGLTQRLTAHKLLRVATPGAGEVEWSRYGEVVGLEDGRVSMRVLREQVAEVTARLLAELPVADLAVEEPPLEALMDQVFQGTEVSA